MKNIISIFILITIILLPAASCKKNATNDPLPLATQTGANTMGCYVNGRPWLPDTRDNGSIPRLPKISIDMYSAAIIDFRFNRNREGDNQRIIIYLNNFSGTGNFVLNKESDIRGFSPMYGYYENHGAFINYNPNSIYSTSSLATGSILITRFDKVEKIISGTFNYKAKMANSLDSITISNGRFDCKFNQ